MNDKCKYHRAGADVKVELDYGERWMLKMERDGWRIKKRGEAIDAVFSVREALSNEDSATNAACEAIGGLRVEERKYVRCFRCRKRISCGDRTEKVQGYAVKVALGSPLFS